MIPKDANERLDRVCRNCGERFGMHYGPVKGVHTCKKKIFDEHYDKDNDTMIANTDRFIHNGRYVSKSGIDWSKKRTPNELFVDYKRDRRLREKSIGSK